MAPNHLLEPRVGHLPRPERLDHDRDRVGHTDGVGHLNHGALGESGRHHVLGHVPRHIARRAVDLRRILAREGAAAVRAGAAVGVDDDLAPGEPGIPHRPAGDEAAGRVHVEDTFLAIEQLGRNRGHDDAFDDVLAEALVRDVGTVLGGDHHRLDRPRLAVHVADRDLRLPVRPQVIHAARLPELTEPHHEFVREDDRQGHQLGRLRARIAEHQALVAGAEVVHAHGDVAGLLVDGRDHAARLVIEAVLGAGVTDLADRLAGHARNIDVARGGDLAGHDDETGGQQRLTRHAPDRILADDGIQDRVGDLVRDLVGVTFGHRLRREEIFIPRHAFPSRKKLAPL